MAASGGREKKKRECSEVLKATESALEILGNLTSSGVDSDD
jgi:hypothetical protein